MPKKLIITEKPSVAMEFAKEKATINRLLKKYFNYFFNSFSK